MWYENYINTKTGKIIHITSPRERPTGPEWIRLSDEQYNLILKAIEWAKKASQE